MTFDILQHLDQLEPDGGTNNPRGDHSYKCPACGASNFKVHVVSGKWGAYGCECSSTAQRPHPKTLRTFLRTESDI